VQHDDDQRAQDQEHKHPHNEYARRRKFQQINVLSHACHTAAVAASYYGTGVSKENNGLAGIGLKTPESWRN
jgi:hypothetical protein